MASLTPGGISDSERSSFNGAFTERRQTERLGHEQGQKDRVGEVRQQREMDAGCCNAWSEYRVGITLLNQK
jgi:hypothetical protein